MEAVCTFAAANQISRRKTCLSRNRCATVDTEGGAGAVGGGVGMGGLGGRGRGYSFYG